MVSAIGINKQNVSIAQTDGVQEARPSFVVVTKRPALEARRRDTLGCTFVERDVRSKVFLNRRQSLVAVARKQIAETRCRI